MSSAPRVGSFPGGEIAVRSFEPPSPLPAQRSAAAIEFWLRAAADARISVGFRALCEANGHNLARLADQVG